MCRLSTFQVEYNLAVDAEGESIYTPEDFENLLARSAIAGLEPKYRKKAKGLSLKELYEYLRGNFIVKASKTKSEADEERKIAEEKARLAATKWTLPAIKVSSLDVVDENTEC